MRVVVQEPGQVAFSAPLGARLAIGRQDQNDVVIRGARASRHHAAIERDGDRFVLRDLGSRHGTIVNGQPLKAPMFLADGDRIQIADALVVFRATEDPGRATTRPLAELGARAGGFPATVARALRAIASPDTLIDELLGATLEAVACDAALVGLGEARAQRAFVRAREGSRAGPPVVARANVDAMLARRELVHVRDADGREGIGAPLVANDAALGFLWVEDAAPARGAPPRFVEHDLEFVATLAHLVAQALDAADRLRRATATAVAFEREAGAPEIVGTSTAAEALRAEATRLASAPNAHALLRGEAGAEVETIARLIHGQSTRAREAFVVVNAPEATEERLFGPDGALALANHGSLLLQSVHDLAAVSQQRLFKTLQDGELDLGDGAKLRLDVRVLSTTHADLFALVQAKRFREDLYQRLAVGEIVVPPLRERTEDIDALALHFLTRAATRLGKRLAGFTANALLALKRHRWSGNVAELGHEIERAALLAETALVDVADLSPRVGGAAMGARALDSPVTLQSAGAAASRTLAERFSEIETAERHLLEEAIATARGDVAEAARLLGVTRVMLKRRLERLQVG